MATSRIAQVVEAMNAMELNGVAESYAIGGAVGATFYIEPFATFDVDVFVHLKFEPGKTILDPLPIFGYLKSKGFSMDQEYVMIAEWPVQILCRPVPWARKLSQRQSPWTSTARQRPFLPPNTWLRCAWKPIDAVALGELHSPQFFSSSCAAAPRTWFRRVPAEPGKQENKKENRGSSQRPRAHLAQHRQ